MPLLAQAHGREEQWGFDFLVQHVNMPKYNPWKWAWKILKKDGVETPRSGHLQLRVETPNFQVVKQPAVGHEVTMNVRLGAHPGGFLGLPMGHGSYLNVDWWDKHLKYSIYIRHGVGHFLPGDRKYWDGFWWISRLVSLRKHSSNHWVFLAFSVGKLLQMVPKVARVHLNPSQAQTQRVADATVEAFTAAVSLWFWYGPFFVTTWETGKLWSLAIFGYRCRPWEWSQWKALLKLFIVVFPPQ